MVPRTRRLIGRLIAVAAIGAAIMLQGASANARSVPTHRTSYTFMFPGTCHDMPAHPKTYHNG